MWTPEGKQIEKDSLGGLTPREVLFEFEEPLTFVSLDHDGQPLLAHSLCAEGSLSRYLISVTDQRTVDELKAGRLDVLGALRQPRCWIADIAAGSSVAALWLVDFNSVPERVLPRAGAMLTPDLEPLLRVRLIGKGLGPGKTSATDVRMAAQAGESSLKRLAEITFKRRKRAGRPSRQLRHYFDLPVPYLGAASFEIAYGSPPKTPQLFEQDAEVFAEMSKLLATGVRLVQTEDAHALSEEIDPEDVMPLLEAMRMLTPPIQGDVDRIEVGGRLIEDLQGRTTLTRDDRRRVIEKIKPAREISKRQFYFVVSGEIREADQDEFTFTLRNLEPPELPNLGPVEEILFHFEEHLFEDVMDAFNSSRRVSLVGEKYGADYLAIRIEFEGDWSPEGSETPSTISE